MRILFIGDIVGAPGVQIVRRAVPLLRARERLDLVVANAENASGGSGLYPNTLRQLKAAGIDAFTMGDHLYRKADLIPALAGPEPIAKPANFPAAAPGRDHVVVRTVRCVLVDAHAEATADKYLLAHHLKGRVTAVLGTHTHVPTADERVFPEGTAFVCDVGMTGPYDGILGRRADRVLPTTITFVPAPFDVAAGDVRLGGAIVDADEATGKATGIRRVMVTEADVASWEAGADRTPP
jgi:calcineurin-like phosphoesterase